ncbi:hypothetical protein QJQ45_020167 [Haematococcus lacustris]|nr:hypothetical protein QJQ45_020167 [Haematococcus lacustris]
MSQGNSCSRLLNLPTELLSNIFVHVSQLGQHSSYNAGRQLQLSCKTLKQAVTLHWPRLRIDLDDNCFDPSTANTKLARVLRSRQSKLEVELHYGNEVGREDGAEGGKCDNHLVTLLLETVATCTAVQQLSLTSHLNELAPEHHLSWPSRRTRLLRKCFPSLTSLSVSGFLLGSGALAGLADASQQLGLQQLHVSLCAMKEPREGERVKAVPLDNVFSGCRLQQLRLDIWWRAIELPTLQPLASHLTRLTLALPAGYESAEDCLPLVQGLSQLRVLHLTMPQPLPREYNSWNGRHYKVEEEEGQEYVLDFIGLPQLVQCLPSLHSLRLPPLHLRDQDMGPLLAITQLTHILPLFQSQLSRSYAHAACGWRHLDRQGIVGPELLETLAYLPLHSLTHPLHIPELLVDANQATADLATAVMDNVASQCKVPVIIGSLTLRCPTAPEALYTDGAAQLAVVEALVAQLQPIVIKEVKVMGLHSVTPRTVRALAPACRAASSVSLRGGPMVPGLEVWLELLRCMPAMTSLDITGLSSHLGDMEDGLWWLRRHPPRPGGLEVSLWAPGTTSYRGHEASEAQHQPSLTPRVMAQQAVAQFCTRLADAPPTLPLPKLACKLVCSSSLQLRMNANVYDTAACGPVALAFAKVLQDHAPIMENTFIPMMCNPTSKLIDLHSVVLLVGSMAEFTEASDVNWLSLPPELIGNIFSRLCQETRASQLREHRSCMEGRSLQQSCKTLKKTVLHHWPRLTILLNEPQNPFGPPPLVSDNLIRALQTRQEKLEVVLWYQYQMCIRLDVDDNGCIMKVLEGLPPCIAVQRLSLQCDTNKRRPAQHLSWPNTRTRLMRRCFPSLTSLSVSGFRLGSGALAGLVDASQQLGLQQLHVSRCKMEAPAFGCVEARSLENVLNGCRLQQLSLDVCWRAIQPPSPQPLAQHLTHLTMALPAGYESMQDCLPLLQGLSQLRVLHLTKLELDPDFCELSEYELNLQGEEEEQEDQEFGLGFSGLPQLVQCLPSLQSLRLPPLYLQVQDMGPLLAITQLTCIQPLIQSQLSHSYADAASSWRHLQWHDSFYKGRPGVLQTLAYLPLHSLTHPLHIPELLVDANHGDLDLTTAAVENLASRCKAPVSIGFLTLRCPTAPNAACTDGGVQLAVVEALVAQLQHIAIWGIKVMGLVSVTPSTVRALAPACRAASSVMLQGGPMAPGLEVWLELLRCMPAMTHLNVTGLSSHLGDMEQGLRQLRQHPSEARGPLEVRLWAPGTDTDLKGLPRSWCQLVSGRGFPKVLVRSKKK